MVWFMHALEGGCSSRSAESLWDDFGIVSPAVCLCSFVPKRRNQGEAHRKCPCVLFPGRNINQGSCPVVKSTTEAWQTQVDG